MGVLKQQAMMFLTLGIVTCLACPAIVYAGDDSEGRSKSIIDFVMHAYGGKAEIGRVTAVVARGAIMDFMKGKQGEYARYYSRPGKLRIDIMPDQGGGDTYTQRRPRLAREPRGPQGGAECPPPVDDVPVQLP